MRGLRGAQLFDGFDFIDDPVVVVDGAEVVQVGGPVPDGCPIDDLGDVTILPGLVDCHQHLVFDGVGTLEEQVADMTDDQLRDRARANARTALEGGVTTLRDLGDRGYVTLDLREDPELPTICSAGPPITPPKGHCWYLGGETQGLDALRSAVEERAERGVDVVKIMVTGGAMTPAMPVWMSQFSEDEVRLVIDESHRHGLPVAAHCHGVDGISMAVDLGVDTIEHCSFFTADMESAPPDELLDRLAESEVALSATWGNNKPPRYGPLWEQAVPVIKSALGRVHAQGGTVVVGTDAGIHGLKPHDVLPHAMPTLLEAGMTVVEALRAITSSAADVCRRPERGRLGSGLPADIVAVAGDPLDDMMALTRVHSVWKDGAKVERSGPAAS